MDHALSARPIKTGTTARFLGLVAVLAAAAFYVSERYTLGIDFQKYRCLPEIVYLIDTWSTPTASEIDQGDYIAVRLDPAQLPDYVTRTNQVWIKRVVAKEPGTVMQVRRDGVFFELGGERWRHGTALEGAERLGRSEAEFVRDVTLGEGEMFLMGDLPLSYDARYFGAVSEANVVGTVLFAF